MALRPDLEARIADYIAYSEGESLHKYLDTEAVPTIGNGFNLWRGDAKTVLQSIGIPIGPIFLTPACRRGPPHSAQACGIKDQITHEESRQLLLVVLRPMIQEAAMSVSNFEKLTDARKFVICDLTYNLGITQWDAFYETRQLIDEGNFERAAQHLKNSAWYQQVGDRALRDVAMLRTGEWLPADYSG
jgi:GH24 family phage-related lysozyme (muramidase)